MAKQQNGNRSRLKSLLTIVLIGLVGAIIGAVCGMLAGRLSKQMSMSPAQFLAPPFEGRKQIYILALGEDNTGTKSKDIHGRSDTVLVAAVDLDKKQINAISIPRDTRCIIPGRDSYDKINAAYAIGGPELSRQTAEGLLGIPIQYYIKTNIGGLKSTVDSVGGVEIDIEKNMHYRDRRGGLNINLRKGYRHLNGDQALQYVRFRHDVMGDITRIQRQQKFLRAIARRMFAKENLTKLPSIIEGIKANVETNMSDKDLLYLAKLARHVQPDEIQMETLPGAPENIDGISYWVHDTAKAQLMVDTLLRFLPPPDLKPSVEVLNGTGIQGAAAKIAERLTQSGYQVMSTGNAKDSNLDTSEVRTRIGITDEVRQLSTLLYSIRIVEIHRQSDTDTDVTVIVGKDIGL
ncbi:MAG: LCP family protein [Armatimonadota bacterium]|nr:LCP family protein [Armatimonadota bacterium]